MLITVDPGSPVGLADQIAAAVRTRITAGDLAAGDRLPPARELARGLDVNMHTVLRAFATLQAEGLIEVRRGRGAQVTEGAAGLGSRQWAELAGLIEQVRRCADRLGLSEAQLIERITKTSTGKAPS